MSILEVDLGYSPISVHWLKEHGAYETSGGGLYMTKSYKYSPKNEVAAPLTIKWGAYICPDTGYVKLTPFKFEAITYGSWDMHNAVVYEGLSQMDLEALMSKESIWDIFDRFAVTYW